MFEQTPTIIDIVTIISNLGILKIIFNKVNSACSRAEVEAMIKSKIESEMKVVSSEIKAINDKLDLILKDAKLVLKNDK